MQAIANVNLSPKTAYSLLRYTRLFDAEFELVEKKRVGLLKAAAGSQGEKSISLEQGTPEFGKFLQDFVDFLATESELKPCPLPLVALLDEMGTDPANTLSAQDLAVLEPFFIVEQDTP